MKQMELKLDNSQLQALTDVAKDIDGIFYKVSITKTQNSTDIQTNKNKSSKQREEVKSISIKSIMIERKSDSSHY